MADWVIDDKDIESTERILLPNGAHFPDDARAVIRCWHSADVVACPGSGKTTVLLAKLKLLADRMPFEDGSGICVLSHTNVAVDGIRERLSGYADKILGYPNYIGTIQSFIDRFVTLPYLRRDSGHNIQAVDDHTYAQQMLYRILYNRKYYALKYVTNNNYEKGGQYKDRIEHTKGLYLKNGALYVGKQIKKLAGPDTKAATQFDLLIKDLLLEERIMQYQDAYLYAECAVQEMPDSYTELFSARFKYVFIDEYQDCNSVQRQAIEALFDIEKCAVIKIGDPDQAIYNSANDETPDWIPEDGYYAIQSSCRYSQEIANSLCDLKKDRSRIISSAGYVGFKPVLLIFDSETIDRVLDGFINELEKHELNDSNGTYKAIGAVRKEESAGLKIGSYWDGFDGSVKKKSEYNYWLLIDEIVEELNGGKLYLVERVVRKTICKVFHYLKINNQLTGREYSIKTIKKFLNEEVNDIYRCSLYDMSSCKDLGRQKVDFFIRELISNILERKFPTIDDAFGKLPDFFLEDSVIVEDNNIREKENVFIDPKRGRRIVFDTIHGVKGETHDATLYLETDRSKASDLRRILPIFGVGKPGSPHLLDYSRKLAYVGFSRPRTLLCVAMKSETYEKSGDVFDRDWKIVDLRK